MQHDVILPDVLRTKTIKINTTAEESTIRYATRLTKLSKMMKRV